MFYLLAAYKKYVIFCIDMHVLSFEYKLHFLISIFIDINKQQYYIVY